MTPENYIFAFFSLLISQLPVLIVGGIGLSLAIAKRERLQNAAPWAFIARAVFAGRAESISQ